MSFSISTIKREISLIKKESKEKILFIMLIVAMFMILMLAKAVYDSNFNTNNNSSKEIYHVISKFDLMPSAASKATPAIVHIAFDKPIVYKQELNHKQQYGFNIYKPLQKKYQSLGSGVIVREDGYILTNNHVIENLAGKIRVEVADNKNYSAKIIGRDTKTDLAVIKIDANKLPCIEFADSDSVRIGDVVLAIGNPFGIGESVTMGIISATGRSNIGIVDYEDFIQTDAAINPGNSGGALVDIRGELVGINTAILTKSGGYEGISFAIPSNMALRIFNEILKKGKVERGWIGLAVQNSSSGATAFPGFKFNKGLIVADVISGSPASVSGIKKDDILISADGTALRDKSHLRNLVANSEIGKRISFKVLRNGKFLEVQVKISKLPDDINIFDVNR